jgi:hypothetical protein
MGDETADQGGEGAHGVPCVRSVVMRMSLLGIKFMLKFQELLKTEKDMQR